LQDSVEAQLLFDIVEKQLAGLLLFTVSPVTDRFAYRMLTRAARLECGCALAYVVCVDAHDCCGLLELLTPPELQAVLAHACAPYGGQGATCAQVPVVVACGVLWSAVFMHTSLSGLLTPPELQAVLAHREQ
jgi:hypothetical protein